MTKSRGPITEPWEKEGRDKKFFVSLYGVNKVIMYRRAVSVE